jgi:hypothetical protein
MTHTERTHLLFGTGLALMGLLAMLAAQRRNGVAAAAWPVLAFCIGLVLFIPVESQTRTYRTMEWGSFLATLIPDHPATWIGDWLERARLGKAACLKSFPRTLQRRVISDWTAFRASTKARAFLVLAFFDIFSPRFRDFMSIMLGEVHERQMALYTTCGFRTSLWDISYCLLKG